MKKFTILVALIFIINAVSAQQLHFTSQYLQHNAMYNPGAAGIANKDMTTGIFKTYHFSK